MSARFRNWLACPACDSDDEIGVLTHKREMVLECYECGRIAEFTIGEDVPFNGTSVSTTEEPTTAATNAQIEESRHDDSGNTSKN